MKCATFTYRRVCKYSVPYETLGRIWADAAAWMEANPGYDAHVAIMKATDHLSSRLASAATLEFSDSFGAWGGDDEGVLMLLFAAASAGDLI